jgi:hypothetical protein
MSDTVQAVLIDGKPIGYFPPTSAENVTIFNDTNVEDALTYVMSEHIVGKWINGKPIYEKTLSIGSLPNASTSYYSHNISDLDQFIDVKGIGVTSTKTAITIPWVNTTTPTDSVQIVLTSADVRITAGTDRSGLLDL